MVLEERVEAERAEVRAVLHHYIATLIDAWGDHTAAALWRTVEAKECTSGKAAILLADLMTRFPLVLAPVRLHGIEAMVRRLWRYVAWQHATGSLSSEEVELWAKVLEAWQSRAWSTRDRISA